MLVLSRQVNEGIALFSTPDQLRRIADELERQIVAEAEEAGKKPGDKTLLPPFATIEVVKLAHDKTRLGFIAPQDIQILRKELDVPVLELLAVGASQSGEDIVRS